MAERRTSPFFFILLTGFLTCLFIGGIAAGTKGLTEGIILFFTGAPREIIVMKVIIEGAWAVAFGMLGALPVPAIIRKLRTNRLIPDPGNGKAHSNSAR